MLTKVELIDISMRKDKKCGKYLFTLTYHTTYENGRVDEYIIKDVTNPFSTNTFEIDRDSGIFNDRYICNKMELILETRALPIISNKVTCRTIKEADPIEVTMEDIEEKYGCPIKIVKSKEDK